MISCQAYPKRLIDRYEFDSMLRFVRRQRAYWEWVTAVAVAQSADMTKPTDAGSRMIVVDGYTLDCLRPSTKTMIAVRCAGYW